MPVESRQSDLIDLSKVVDGLRQSVGLIALFIAIGVALTFAYCSTLPPLYRAYAVVVSSASGSTADSSSLSSQLSGLAGFGGSQAVDQMTVALETMSSRHFVLDFINSENIVKELTSGVGWDPKNGWRYDKESAESVSPMAIYESFMANNFYFERDRETGLVTLSMVSLSPVSASAWLDKMIVKLNTSMRERDVNESQRNIAFLQQKIAETDLYEMETALYELLQQQIRQSMLSSGQIEYSLRVIDPSLVPDAPIKSRQVKLYVLSIAIALMAGITVAMWRSRRR